MEVLQQRSSAENRDLTASEQKRWDEVMRKDTGLLAIAEAEYQQTVENEEQIRRLRAARPATTTVVPVYDATGGGPASPTQRTIERANGHRPPLMLRSKATGELIRAIEHDEPTPCQERAAFDFGDMLATMVTGREVGGAASGGMQQAVVASAGNQYFVRPGFSSEIIDLARSTSVCFRAGARQTMMDTSTLEFVTVNADPVAQWRQPGTAITASHGDYGVKRLIARTLAAAVPIDVETFEDAANLGEVLRMQLAAALGLALDQAAMLGDAGGATPVGIRSTAGINTEAAVGTPTDYGKITSAIQKIYTANYPGDPSGLAWILHPRDAATFDGLTSSADDQPLQPTPWAGALQKLMTTSLPTTEGGGAASIGIIGDFSQLLFGMRTEGLRIEVLREGQITDDAAETHNATSDLKVILRAYLRADMVVLRPSWFTLLDGITAT
jgi:HK97 family phage major capsid protein